MKCEYVLSCTRKIAEMTVDLSSPESGTGSTDSGTRGEDEGMCELGQVRGVRRGPSPDWQRGNEYVRALVHRDSIPDFRKVIGST